MHISRRANSKATWFISFDVRVCHSTGHELKGLMALFHCAIANSAQVLGFPLMCLVSYAGFRIIATSILPISANSLVYGWYGDHSIRL